jgi:hypothetical protein
MTRSGEKQPSQSASPGSGPGQPPNPGRTGFATTDTFGRFIRNLARLEGLPRAQRQKGGEGGR